MQQISNGSASVSIDELADVIRSCNPITETANLFRDALQKLDFDLNNRFCNVQDMKNTWFSSESPKVFFTFFATLFNIDASDMQEELNTENENSSKWSLKIQTLVHGWPSNPQEL